MTADLLAIVPSARRFQAVFAGVVVVDSTRGALLYEPGLPPVLYVPKEDVRLDLLEPDAVAGPLRVEEGWSSKRVRVLVDGTVQEAAPWGSP